MPNLPKETVRSLINTTVRNAEAEGLQRMDRVVGLIARFKVDHVTGRLAASATVDCPQCGGPLDIAMTSQGQTQGQCRTPGCICWSETMPDVDEAD